MTTQLPELEEFDENLIVFGLFDYDKEYPMRPNGRDTYEGVNDLNDYETKQDSLGGR